MIFTSCERHVSNWFCLAEELTDCFSSLVRDQFHIPPPCFCMSRWVLRRMGTPYPIRQAAAQEFLVFQEKVCQLYVATPTWVLRGNVNKHSSETPVNFLNV